jgi:acyl-CoA dehydrogenase
MTAPAEILGLPKPAWAGDDVAMLYDMAMKFLEAEIAPRYEELRRQLRP